MKIFIANLKNELRKLAARKKYYVFLIIEVAMCIMWGLISMAISRASQGVIRADMILSGLPMTVLGFFIQVYIPLIIFMASCDVFSMEVHDGTIRASYMRPVSRAKQYFSKITAVTVVALTYLMVLFVLTTVVQAMGARDMTGILAAFMSYFLDIIPMIVLVMFAGMINQFSGSTSLSMLICIIIYIGLYVAGLVIPQAGSLLFTGYMQWHNVWVGVTLPFFAILSKIGMLAGYGMVFGCTGYYLYERREV